jgi:hypothetical protein
MEHITLKGMLEELTKCILENKERPNYFYKTEYEEGKIMYLPITEVDLMNSRFKTINNDFSEYEWELEESKIYKAIPKEN